MTQKTHSYFVRILILVSFVTHVKAQDFSPPGWTHYSIDPVLPGSSWGTGGPALSDYDGDGDLDVAIPGG
jgi:hypothetical protein